MITNERQWKEFKTSIPAQSRPKINQLIQELKEFSSTKVIYQEKTNDVSKGQDKRKSNSGYDNGNKYEKQSTAPAKKIHQERNNNASRRQNKRKSNSSYGNGNKYEKPSTDPAKQIHQASIFVTWTHTWASWTQDKRIHQENHINPPRKESKCIKYTRQTQINSSYDNGNKYEKPSTVPAKEIHQESHKNTPRRRDKRIHQESHKNPPRK